MNKTLPILAALLLTLSLAAQDAPKKEKREAFVSHLKQHYRPYGFIRNYFTFDSRESYAGQGDLYYFQPKDVLYNQTESEAATSGVPRQDLNAASTFRFLALTTRVGLDIYGYCWRGTEFGGKIEADFYAGLSGTAHKLSGVAQLRLRRAYLTLAWDSLRISDKDVARVQLLIGQEWHPMAADIADVISLNSGAPFGPFNRSPQVRLDARLGRFFTLTAAGLWQMQYLSTGPEGQSADYIAYSKTPEAYLGLSFHTPEFLLRAGADLLSISPRHIGTRMTATDGLVQVLVSDRLTTVSPFLYLQYKHGDFSLKAKTILAESGEHMNMNGGYGVSRVLKDGSYEYTPLRSSASWLSLVYGGRVGAQEEKHPQRLDGILFAGYVYNLGTKAPLATLSDGSLVGLYAMRGGNMRQMWRLSPTLLYTVGRFQFALEYEITSVLYGSGSPAASNGLASADLHWVTNHRVQLMTKFNF